MNLVNKYILDKFHQSSNRLHKFAAFSFLYFLVIVSATFILNQNSNQQFAIQAESFLSGQFDQIRPDNELFHIDTTLVDGKYYWPLGPFPALLQMPFVLLSKSLTGEILPQGYMHLMLNIGILFYAYKFARKFKFNFEDSILLATAFNFGSIYTLISFSSDSWYLSHSVAVFFSIAGLYEYLFGKRRLFLIGVAFGLVYMTRSTAALPILFFIIDIWRKSIPKKIRINQIVALSIPFIFLVLLMMYFNYIRFGSFLSVGYEEASVYPQVLVNMRNEFGLFDPRNILSNIYMYFFMPLDPVFAPDTWHLVSPYFRFNPIGTSFFLVAPIFARLIIFSKKLRESMMAKDLFLATILPVFILLNYYASGFWTYGPRYLLDVFPFWYLLLLMTFGSKRKLGKWDKFVIVLSVLVNFYLITNQPSSLYWRIIV